MAENIELIAFNFGIKNMNIESIYKLVDKILVLIGRYTQNENKARILAC